MGRVKGVPYHSLTRRKIEHYYRTMKNVVKLGNYFILDELRASIEALVNYYNYERYHETLKNVTPSNGYFDRAKELIH